MRQYRKWETSPGQRRVNFQREVALRLLIYASPDRFYSDGTFRSKITRNRNENRRRTDGRSLDSIQVAGLPVVRHT